MRLFFFKIITIIQMTLFTVSVKCQQKDYSYLPSCYHDAKIEKDTLEIDSIGSVLASTITSDDLDVALTKYDIPANLLKESSYRLAAFSADMHAARWKNNSNMISRKKYSSGNAAIIDLRLHMRIENIYMQVLVICDGASIYELMFFSDTNDKKIFNDLLKRIRDHQCLDKM